MKKKFLAALCICTLALGACGKQEATQSNTSATPSSAAPTENVNTNSGTEGNNNEPASSVKTDVSQNVADSESSDEPDMEGPKTDPDDPRFKEAVFHDADPSSTLEYQTHDYVEDTPINLGIYNMEELEQFHSDYREVYESDEFQGLYGGLNEEWFSENILSVYILTAGSGNISYKVIGYCYNPELYEDREYGTPQIVPEEVTSGDIGTDDLSTWFLFTGVSITDEEKVESTAVQE